MPITSSRAERSFAQALQDILSRSGALTNAEQADARGPQANARVLSAAVRESQAKLSEFHAQCLASLAWSLAKSGTEDGLPMEALAAEAIRKVKEQTTQGPSNLV